MNNYIIRKTAELRANCPELCGQYKKDILNYLGIDHFDPLQIVEATKGRMTEDNQYIMIAYKGKSKTV